MLVSMEGAAVYEVTLDTGIVYVDATSGHVVPYIVTAMPAATTSTLATTNATPAATATK